MSHRLLRSLFTPASLVLAMAAVPAAYAQEQITIPGLPLPIAASSQNAQAYSPPADSQAQPPSDSVEQEIEKKPRLIRVTSGNPDLPAVPASTVKRPNNRTQAVETRQDVVVTSGTNTLIPISRGQINRLVTPFENPSIQTVSSAEISTSGNVVYVTTDSDQPVTMFITPQDDETVAISLTLLPQSVPPIQANLVFGKSIQGIGTVKSGVAGYSGQARKWERSQPYMETLRAIFREIALGQLPRGYTFGQLLDGSQIPACQQSNLTFDFSNAQLLEGHDFRVYIAVAKNNSAVTIEFDHDACKHPNRAAVSTWPHVVLEPGQKTEVIIVTRVAPLNQATSVRPSLLQ